MLCNGVSSEDLESQEGFESGLQEKLGSGTREDKEKKKK
jgi:hypothetical protein